MKDVTAGVDYLIDRGIVDSDKTFVIGHSAGGRRANWLTVSTHRFRAIVSKDGWADDWLLHGIHYSRDDKHPVFVPENFQKNSALFHALGASTPTLFLMGNPKLGGIDQYDTVRWLYQALKAQKVETQYVQYPDEGHVFERYENQKDSLERIEKWFDHYVNTPKHNP